MADLAKFAERGAALVRLGELMQRPDAGIDELVEAADACGLRLQFRLRPLTERELKETASCEHVWAYSMGDAYERCALCGEERSVA